MSWLFLLNIALTFIYIALAGEASFFNIIVGFAIGYVLLSVIAAARGIPNYGIKLWRLICFSFYFVYILIKANLEVAWEIITPGMHMKPRIIRYDVTGLNDVQVTTLANVITLTPGTLTADISDEPILDENNEPMLDEDDQPLAKRTIYIHAMYAGDREDAVDALDELRDNLMRNVFS